MVGQRPTHTIFVNGQACEAVLSESKDGQLHVSVRLPDGEHRDVPGRYSREGLAVVAAISFASGIVSRARARREMSESTELDDSDADATKR